MSSPLASGSGLGRRIHSAFNSAIFLSMISFISSRYFLLSGLVKTLSPISDAAMRYIVLWLGTRTMMNRAAKQVNIRPFACLSDVITSISCSMPRNRHQNPMKTNTTTAPTPKSILSPVTASARYINHEMLFISLILSYLFQ